MELNPGDNVTIKLGKKQSDSFLKVLKTSKNNNPMEADNKKETLATSFHQIRNKEGIEGNYLVISQLGT